VTRLEDGRYELIAGERRLRAARMLGLARVPVVVRTATQQQKLELALIENIQRQDLNAVEEAQAFRALANQFSLKQEDVAKRVGKSRSYIANTMRLLELEDDILRALVEGKITRSHARTLLAEGDAGRRRGLFEDMLKGGVTVREAEARAGGAGSAKKRAKDPNLAAMEAAWREALGTKVQIQVSASGRGKVAIHFYSKEELKELQKRLSGS
jgi:ParB family chromosome partitioning protein